MPTTGRRIEKMKSISAVCIFLLAALLIAPCKADEPLNVTLVQLIANPQPFDGKLIRVIGFLRIEFEGDVLYLHREDYENAILGDGIWVEVTPEMTKQTKVLSMNYVLLEGVFNSNERGHMGMWSGTISRIRRAQLWSNVNRTRGVGAPSK